ncbi:MAG: SDR family NAD(P)-dependent oxidoreductase [Alphaproteobacteria bacterium]|nr:SDR family NAD(P)-dependent oxidoreductase [Alphaproteobacteria bacterium]
MTKDIDLTGKVALITGASRGIGAAVAKAYARAGAHVVLLARTVGGLEEVDDAIRAEGGKATLMPVDLLKLEELDNLGPTLYERFGQLDIFVGNAGLLGTLGPLPHADPKEFKKVMDTNVEANFRLIRTLDPLLRASGAGRTILVSTGEGVTKGRAYWGAYSVSKAGVEALANVYAEETANTNVRVNVIDPGSVRTEMRKSAKPGEDPMSLPAPDDIVGEFLNLAATDLTKHGEIVRLR